MRLDDSTKKILSENARMAKVLTVQVKETDTLSERKAV